MLKSRLLPVLFVWFATFIHPVCARAWGRHDLITEIVFEDPAFVGLGSVKLVPEPIEKVAPDLLGRVMPGLLSWCLRYHQEHDDRYPWTIPAPLRGRSLSDREELLWLLEDNTRAPLALGSERTAAEVLARYVDEPDAELDDGLDQPDILARVRASMSYFYEPGTAHTHAFRHYYVPTSLVPPIWSPRGLAPYRAALYAELSKSAFKTGHPYWGYRFLAWSIHYVQDVTQPWHTVFLPGVSFLDFSKQRMRREVASLHYLTEAFMDTWLERRKKSVRRLASLQSLPALADGEGPWQVAVLTETLAKEAHRKAATAASLARSFFSPLVATLDFDLKPKERNLHWGGTDFNLAELNFDGNGHAATQALLPVWNDSFNQRENRDRLLEILVPEIDAAVEATKQVIALTTGSSSS